MRTKKARGGKGEGVGGLSILIGQLGFSVNKSHDMMPSRVFSIVMTACSFGERLKIETTTIFSMLDLESLSQKKFGLLAVNKKSTDPLDV